MIYITGTREQNATALKLVVQKVGGRPCAEESKEELLDPLLEECLYLPSTAVSTVLAGGPAHPELQSILDLYGVSLRTEPCNVAETGITNIRLILKGPQQGRARMNLYFTEALSAWRSAGSLEKIPVPEQEDKVLNYYSPSGESTPVSTELETSLKMTIPSNMLSSVLGESDMLPKEIMRKTKAVVSITPQASPSIELDLVVVMLSGLTAFILRAQEMILLRMLNSKGKDILLEISCLSLIFLVAVPLPRLPVQLSNNINASAGGISSSSVQNSNTMYTSQATAGRIAGISAVDESSQLKQIELQLQALQLQRNSVLSGVGRSMPAAPYPVAAQYTPGGGPHPPQGSISGYPAYSQMSTMPGMPMYHAPQHAGPQIVYVQTPLGLQPMIYPTAPQQQLQAAPQSTGITSGQPYVLASQSGGAVPMMYAMVPVGVDGTTMQPMLIPAPAPAGSTSAPPPPPPPRPPPPTEPKPHSVSAPDAACRPVPVTRADGWMQHSSVHPSLSSIGMARDSAGFAHGGSAGAPFIASTKLSVTSSSPPLNASASVYQHASSITGGDSKMLHYRNFSHSSKLVVLSPTQSPLQRSPSGNGNAAEDYALFTERSFFELTDSPDAGYSYPYFGYQDTQYGSQGFSPTLSSAASMDVNQFAPTPQSGQSHFPIPKTNPADRRKAASMSRSISKGLRGFQSNGN